MGDGKGGASSNHGQRLLQRRPPWCAPPLDADASAAHVGRDTAVIVFVRLSGCFGATGNDNAGLIKAVDIAGGGVGWDCSAGAGLETAASGASRQRTAVSTFVRSNLATASQKSLTMEDLSIILNVVYHEQKLTAYAGFQSSIAV